MAYTNHLKVQQFRELGLLVPLCAGGHPTDPRNLWPQPLEGKSRDADKNQSMCRALCRDAITLEEARALFLAPDWTREYLKFFDIKRTIALQRASAKMEALRSLYSAQSELVTTCTSYACLPPRVRPHALVALNTAAADARSKGLAAAIFLPIAVRQRVAALAAAAHTLSTDYTDNPETSAQENPRIVALLVDSSQVSDLIRAELEAIAT